jgi:hypothetical protein
MNNLTSKQALAKAKSEVSCYPAGNFLRMAFLFKTGRLPKVR